MAGSDVATVRDGEGLGPVVRRLRLAAGMSQQTLGARVGMSRAYVSQIESGERKWPAQYVGALAEALGVRPSELGRAAGRIVRDEDFRAPGEPHRSPSINDESAAPYDDPLLDVLMSGARQLTPAGRQALIDHMETIQRLRRELEADEERNATTDRRGG